MKQNKQDIRKIIGEEEIDLFTRLKISDKKIYDICTN